MKNYKILLGIVIGLLLSGIIVYAESVISGSQVSYQDHAGLGANNVQTAIDQLDQKIKTHCPDGNVCTSSIFKLGDYVQLTPSLDEYHISAVDTGYTSDQTINPSELQLWRVINIDSNGMVDMVSQYTSSVPIYFNGKIGYQNVVGVLNKISNSYTDLNYVISTRHMGYGGATNHISDTSILDSRTSPWTNDSAKNNRTAIEESLGGGDFGYSVDYNLVNAALKTIKAYSYGTESFSSYFLASRSFRYYGRYSWVYSIRNISAEGNVSGGEIYDYYNGEFEYKDVSYSIRPILTLDSNITISGGSGKENDPYTLA